MKSGLLEYQEQQQQHATGTFRRKQAKTFKRQHQLFESKIEKVFRL